MSTLTSLCRISPLWPKAAYFHHAKPDRLEHLQYPRPPGCRAINRSVPSRSLPKPRSRTAPFPNGFVCGRETPSDITPSGGIGARLVSASRLIAESTILPHLKMNPQGPLLRQSRS
ncbi:hypothetical protein HCEG_04339 [Histoplasma capsulatum var. duboisii H88]|uniref:Uncharacterized protein n=1 Tax=Ajellomyces capsulatus (strain H88) TaxID=544711 RepID=F0UGI2_AJEC8|nr:hypothetical protein HCEG_04339 [Histoplasma capsulatum var. duboisii H88]